VSERGAREGLLLPVLLPVGVIALIGLVLFGFSRVLLSTSHAAATVVALIVAASIMTIAAVIAARERQPNGALLSMLAAVTGVAMIAGGIAVVAFVPAEEGGGEGEGPPPMTLSAPPNAAVEGFDKTSLSFPSGRPVDLVFDNADPGVQHNVVIFPEDPAEDPGAEALFTGELVTGPGEITYSISPLEAGTYFFHCEVHPTTMTGSIEVAEGGGPGGGGAVVRASGLAFDTDEIHLPADRESTITFDNRDAGTQHNIAIYEDDTLTTSLFTGDLVTGPAQVEYSVPPTPAGTYYFHCDIHPNMNGSVIVDGEGGGGPPPGEGGPGAGPSPGG
jgi:plastocyanin